MGVVGGLVGGWEIGCRISAALLAILNQSRNKIRRFNLRKELYPEDSCFQKKQVLGFVDLGLASAAAVGEIG